MAAGHVSGPRSLPVGLLPKPQIPFSRFCLLKFSGYRTARTLLRLAYSRLEGS